MEEVKRYKFLMTHGFEPDGEMYLCGPEPMKPARMQGAEYVSAYDFVALQQKLSVYQDENARLHLSIAQLEDEKKAAMEKLDAVTRERDALKDPLRRSPRTACEDLEKGPGAWLSDAERRLRQLLAFAYSGEHLYGDDGESQDSRLPYPIDYMRDSIDQIGFAIYARGANLAVALSAPPKEAKCETCDGEGLVPCIVGTHTTLAGVGEEACAACGGTGKVKDVVDSIDPEWSQGIDYPCPDCTAREGKEAKCEMDAANTEWFNVKEDPFERANWCVTGKLGRVVCWTDVKVDAEDIARALSTAREGEGEG